MGHRRGQLETVRDVLKLQARRRTRLGQLVPQRRLTRRPRVQRSQHRGAHHHRANCQHRARQTPAPPQPPNQQPTTLTRATHPHRSSGEGPARSGTALHAGRAAHPRGARQARGSECGLTQHPSAAERCATAIEGGGPWAARLARTAGGLSRPAVTAPRARPRPSSKRCCVTTEDGLGRPRASATPRSRRPAAESGGNSAVIRPGRARGTSRSPRGHPPGRSPRPCPSRRVRLPARLLPGRVVRPPVPAPSPGVGWCLTPPSARGRVLPRKIRHSMQKRA